MNTSAGDRLKVGILEKASKCEEDTAQELEANSINMRLAKADCDQERVCDDMLENQNWILWVAMRPERAKEKLGQICF